jgi:hypothetical protein
MGMGMGIGIGIGMGTWVAMMRRVVGTVGIWTIVVVVSPLVANDWLNTGSVSGGALFVRGWNALNSPFYTLERLSQDDIPDFFIIGTAKSGTTSLHDLLSAHSDICFNDVKEKHFFDKNSSFSQGFQYYRKLFKTSSPECRYLLDSTPAYMRVGLVPERMSSYYTPAALAKKKLIVILRDPVKRECSWYHHHVRGCVVHMNNYMHHNEPNSDGSWNVDHLCNDAHGYCASLQCKQRLANVKSRFVENLLSFDEKFQLGNVAASESFYDEQLNGYLKVFKRNQIFIISFDDLISRTKDIVRKLGRFLDLNEKFGNSISLPTSNVNKVNSTCSCEALARLRKVHEARGTLQRTMEIVNSTQRHPMEPVFTPFRLPTLAC